MAEPGRRTFAPVVLSGLGAAALTALAGNQDLIAPTGDPTLALARPGSSAAQLPLVSALGLVTLAGWGVLLVTRRRTRRVVAPVTLLAAVGVLVALVAGFWMLPDGLRETLAVPGTPDPDLAFTGWFWAALPAAVVSVVAAAAANRYLSRWPEMGSRYDAPTDGAAAGGTPVAHPEADPATDEGNLEMWRAIEEGRDPTDPGST